MFNLLKTVECSGFRSIDFGFNLSEKKCNSLHISSYAISRQLRNSKVEFTSTCTEAYTVYTGRAYVKERFIRFH